MNSESLKIYHCAICAHKMETHFLNETEFLKCERCGRKEKVVKEKSFAGTLSYSLAALILFLAANILPFMTFELYGNTNTSTILGGIKSLLQSGAWLVAIVVLLASLIIPLFKILGLLFLTLPTSKKVNPHFRTKVYLFIEAIGRWSMLDIFLLAVLVATVKLGTWASVTVEPGSFLFLLVVLFTMLASKSFDPRLIWEGYSDEKSVQKK